MLIASNIPIVVNPFFAHFLPLLFPMIFSLLGRLPDNRLFGLGKDLKGSSIFFWTFLKPAKLVKLFLMVTLLIQNISTEKE
jgi:hypothetical protein